MSDKVKRFEPYADEGNRYGYGEMEEDPMGDWVSYEDYKALEAELTEARLEVLSHLGQAQEA